MTRVYIAGPMRGCRYYNFPAFDAAAATLLACGFDVMNPAQLDRDETNFDPFSLPADHDWNKVPEGFDLNECIRRDIEAVRWCDMIYLLDGWEESTGARAEKALAEWLGKRVAYESDTTPCGDVKMPDGEVRVTDPLTGGQKGSKPERFDLIPVEPLEEIARVYGWGATKYEDDNWRRGYSWRLSFAAMMRHAWAFWRGETKDAESGLHHLAHVAWHCLTLMWFTSNRKDHDDRWAAPCWDDDDRWAAPW